MYILKYKINKLNKIFFYLIGCINIINSFYIEEEKIIKSVNMLTDKNIRAFLNFISRLEGTKDQKNLENYKSLINEYKIQFTGKIFDNLTDHPREIISSNGLRSSAAGRYQFIQKTWDKLLKIFPNEIIKNKKFETGIKEYFKKKRNIYLNNNLYNSLNDLEKFKFGPFWQDLGALLLIQIEGNLELDVLLKKLKEKKYKEIINKLSNIWASFPAINDKSFYENQPSFKIKNAINILDKYMNNLKETK